MGEPTWKRDSPGWHPFSGSRVDLVRVAPRLGHGWAELVLVVEGDRSIFHGVGPNPEIPIRRT
jgi:hypothetical protein